MDESERPILWVLAAAVLCAVVLRFTGIGYGLPGVFNGDEPHYVNVAVSFGRGSLNPVHFKYPTLWMYILFGAYGVYGLAWSAFGLLHPFREFGRHFVWHPEHFFLIGRLLAAAVSLAALVPAFLAGRRLGGPRAGAWAVALLAASPVISELTHAAKPDCLMLFWSAWAVWAALRYLDTGRGADLGLCSVFVGLAGSTQYTAAPLAVVVPAAWWARRLSHPGPEAPSFGQLAAWSLLMPAAFVLASPYTVLDAPAFLRGLRDNWGAYGHDAGRLAGLTVAGNFLTWAGVGSPGGVLFLAGCARLLRERRPQAALLLTPAVAFCLFFALQSEGGWHRYLMGIHTVLAVVAGFGAEWALTSLTAGAGRRAALHAVCAALLMAPGAWQAWRLDRDWLLVDTRNLAAAWFQEHVPAGSGVLSDLQAESPPLRLSQAQARRLLERTAGLGRRKYYELMLESHPGGGWDVYQVNRDPKELHVGAWHAQASVQERAVLEPGEGLRGALDAGIEYVVLTSNGAGAGGTSAARAYVRDVETLGALEAEFRPEPGKIRGPVIRVYKIAGRTREGAR